jgi:succinoglycan biosynthesis protein ExoL
MDSPRARQLLAEQAVSAGAGWYPEADVAADRGTPVEYLAVNGGGSEPAREAERDGAGEDDRAPRKRVRVAYFGPDIDDPAVRRRVAQWTHAGYDVIAAAFSRRGRADQPEGTINFGRVLPRSRLRRVVPMVLAALRLLSLRKRLAGIDLFVARNIDNVFLALLARRLSGSAAPLVYEVLDINTSCTATGMQALLLRRLETWALARVCLLVVSSPYFVSAYYQKLLNVSAKWLLFENKVPRYARLPRARPLAGGKVGRRWCVGWFGYLDDARSWHILRRLARALPDQVSLSIRGMPYDNFDMQNFLRDIEDLDNAVYGGPFRNPDDLAEIYGAVDLVWSADCNELAANSKWLLTNGIYEAGYFGKPVIGLARTAIGEFLAQYQSGWALDDPPEEALVTLLRTLTPEAYLAKQQAILDLSQDHFVETDEIDVIWTTVQNHPVRRSVKATAPDTGEKRALRT